MRLVSTLGISPNIMLLERSKLVIKPSTVIFRLSSFGPQKCILYVNSVLVSPSLEKVVAMDVKFWKHLGIIFKVQNLENCETTEFIRNGTVEIICTKAKNYQMWKAWANPNWNASNPDFLYLASKDAATPSFLKRSFNLSDCYEAKMKKDTDGDDGDHSDGGNGGDDGDGDDDDHVDPKLQKSGNKHISENKYPTGDARIDIFSEDELIKLIASLEAKIQASTLGIDSMERYYAVKQNQNLSQTHSSSSKTLGRLNPAYFDVQMPPSQDPVNPFIHDALGQKVTHELAQLGGFNKNLVNSTTTSTTTSVMESKNPMNITSTSAMELKPPLPLKCPMLPSAWILNSELQKKI
ncbi:hypothetical protein ACFX2C_044616 [Malus domestica]